MRLNALSTDDLQYFEARFFLVPATGTVYIDPKLSVIRQRAVGGGFHEELTVLSHSAEPADLTIRIDAESDFADLFEVKDALPKLGTYDTRVDGDPWSWATGARRSRARPGSPPRPGRDVDEHGLTFSVQVEPHGTWTTDLDVVAVARAARSRHSRRRSTAASNRRAKPTWRRASRTGSARRRTSSATGSRCKATYRRSLVDLAALRFSPPIAGGRSLPAAGLPWFMTMFGRDSIFTSLQSLPFAPELAATTLRVLGDWQGTRLDDFRDEDPGRILHEMRYGEMAAFEERPHSPYYGSADATPLYVILLDEYERWTGDRALVRTSSARRARRSTGSTSTPTCMGNGYISYKRRNEQTGLENQCWKDSWNSISYARRPPARLPAGDLRAAGLRLRREDPRRPAGPAGLEGRRLRGPARDAGGGPQAPVQPRLLARRTAATTRSPSTPTAARSTRSRRTSATCCGAASSTRTRRSRSSAT